MSFLAKKGWGIQGKNIQQKELYISLDVVLHRNAIEIIFVPRQVVISVESNNDQIQSNNKKQIQSVANMLNDDTVVINNLMSNSDLISSRNSIKNKGYPPLTHNTSDENKVFIGMSELSNDTTNSWKSGIKYRNY